jgi:hypothetical protein
MKKHIILATVSLLLFYSFCEASSRRRAMMLAKPALVAGGGPDVWYDIEVEANRDASYSFSGTDYSAAEVTVGVAGTATLLRLHVANGDLVAHNIKLALYDNAGNLLSSGSVSVAPTDDNVYKEVTLSPSVAVTATTYIIAIMGDDGNLFFNAKAGVGALDAWVGKVYASFPYDPIGTPDFNNLARNMVAGIYVD